MSLYRNVVWFAKGYQEYTKGGYLKKAKNFKPLTRDLTGKTILITGGNSGIGLDAACILGGLGANIHIACRSKERGEAAIQQIKEKAKVFTNFIEYFRFINLNLRMRQLNIFYMNHIICDYDNMDHMIWSIS